MSPSVDVTVPAKPKAEDALLTTETQAWIDSVGRSLLQLKLKQLPESVPMLYGCHTCELRCSDRCPGYEPITNKFNMPDNSICNSRLYWLISLTPFYEQKPSLARWQFDFNRTLVNSRMLKEKEYLEELERLASDKYLTKEDRAILQGKIGRERMNWERLVQLSLKYVNQQVERETPKKIEVQQRRDPTPSEIRAWMQEAAINVTPTGEADKHEQEQ